MRKKRYLVSVSGWAILFLYSLFLLIPLYMVIITSFKSRAEFYNNPIGLPVVFQFSNYVNAFVEAKILQSGLNSLIVTGASVASLLVINVFCSYGIHKLYHTRTGSVLYSIIMLGMMIPAVGYVTLILLYRSFRLYNNLYGLIVNIVAGSVPFSVFILVGFLRTIPRDMEEASLIDGCSNMQTLRFVLLPLIKPAVTTVAIFNIITSWNNLFAPLLLVNKQKLFTIPLAMLAFKGNYSTDYGLMFAGVITVSVPLLIVYFIFQKNFIESLAGGLKG
jgi:raffinose/stachyose/melibiose transport system permease protein